MNETNNINEKLFLETSVYIKRLFGAEEERHAIENIVKNKVIFSSAFIIKEFRDVVLEALIKIFFLIYNDEQSSPIDAFRKYKLLVSHEPRALKMGFDVGVLLLEKKGLPSDRTQALFEMEALIREVESKFNSFINNSHFIDNVQCPAGKSHLIKTDDPIGDFSKFISDYCCPDNCCREIFLRRRKEYLKDILQSDLSSYKTTKYRYKSRKEFFDTLLPLYQKIVNTQLLSNNDYKNKLGDTIIALESPSTATLISYDFIYQILCELLKKNQYIIPSISTKKIRKLAQSPRN